MNTSEQQISADVLVIGGGPAGLSASITLARSLRSVILVDAGQQRNLPADGAHNVLGNEGMAPRDILAKGREEAEAVGVQIIKSTVTELTGQLGNFTAHTAEGTEITATRVVLATGLRDVLPEIKGLENLWGKTALHCPYCHGYEVRDQKIAVLGTSPMSWHQALLFRQLSPKVTLLQAVEQAPEHRAALERIGVEIIEDTPVAVRENEEGKVVVSLASGAEFIADAVAVAPTWEVNSSLYESLGGSLIETPMGRLVPTDTMGKTDIPGIWSAGNVKDFAAMVQTSSAQGIAVGAGINMEMAMQAAGLA